MGVGAGGSWRSPWGEGRACGCSTPSAWKWLADRTPGRICLKLCLTHFLIPSSRYRNLLGAVLPPIPAALRWHADIQPPAGLHRVAHYSGGPAGLRPFRLLPDCILSTLEKGLGWRCLNRRWVGDRVGFCVSPPPQPWALLVSYSPVLSCCRSFSLIPSTQAFNNLENLVFGKGFQAKIFPESK